MNDRTLWRAKTKKDGTWVYGNAIESDYATFILPRVSPLESSFTLVIPETLGQFTGKYYQKKLAIYEGDVFVFTPEPDISDEPEYLLVYWDNALSGFLLKSSENSIPEDFDFDFTDPENVSEIELIGNIHDNPELLEKFKY